jgi:hypothetical protein
MTRAESGWLSRRLIIWGGSPIFKRLRKRPWLNRSDRVFWIVLAKVWKNWRH